jgi:arabinose-5-phosphate isomerase
MQLHKKLRLADAVVCTGVGKSGDVARLGASLLQSVGVNAQFIHAVDMLHGGLGIFNTRPDNRLTHLILFSHSGETREIVTLFEQLPETVETTLITGNCAFSLDVNNYRGYDLDHDGSVHKTIPVYSSMEQVRVIGEIVCDIANDLTAEQLLDNHPAGKLAQAYAKEIGK